MRLLSFHAGGKERFGALVDGGVTDLRSRLSGRYRSLDEFLTDDALAAAQTVLERASPDFALDDIAFRPPIRCPEKIICIGVNYVNRNDEYRDGSEPQQYPSIFLRTAGSLVGHREPIFRPPESEQLDYEGELAVIVGRGGRRIPRERALEHVAGVTCMNEGSVRDWMRHAKFNVTQGKNFARSGAIGPWMVTLDEFGALDDVRLQTRVNGELRQNDTTANMIFDVPFLISYVSTFAELRAGDIIATGTPTGAGVRFDPPRWLRPGDVVEVEITGIGTLRNEVVVEPMDEAS